MDIVAPVALAWSLTATNVTQWHPPFRSPYAGELSLDPHGRTEETSDLTFYGETALWRGGELLMTAEIDQGHGVGDGVGIAGYPSGEAKIGANRPYLHLPRLFVRHTEGDLVVTAGRFSVADIFDTNAYAHDPRGDFLNYALFEAGAFDYASDPWGFTNGVAVEWARDAWTLRGGAFQLPRTANARITARVDFGAYMLVGEVERRYTLADRSGKIRLTGFVDRARMGRYRDALDAARRRAGGVPELESVRRDTSKAGAIVSLEQEISPAFGVFARASANDGAIEAYEYTEINRSLAAGFQWKGLCWGREEDTVGVGVAVNALSGAARDYFAAGGIGIVIGDGALSYRAERIVEAYYAWRVEKRVAITFDVQHVRNPAYNADRGPVNLFALRTHLEF